MEICVFSSGSCGNCTLVQTKNLNILIDAGITKKAIDENLINHNLTLNDINYVLITHEHADHVRAFLSLLKYDNIKILMSIGTYNELLKANKSKEKFYDLIRCKKDNGDIILLAREQDHIHYVPIKVLDLTITPIPAYHDAAECVGYVIEDSQNKLVNLTDTGYVHNKIFDLIADATCYILESNHDPQILMNSERPYYLKQRILSDHGHLSNQDSMIVLAKIMGPNTKLVMHAHVSQECNLTKIIELTRKNIFNEYGIITDGIKFVVLGETPSEDFSI